VFDNWIEGTKNLLGALQATDADNASIADVIENSFQTCLDEACSRMLGTKIVGPSAMPKMTHALAILDKQRQACDYALRRVMSNPSSTDEERSLAGL
jgi:hypothetical protein